MLNLLKKMKDKLFYVVVEKNPYILEDYQIYKWSHSDISKENKLKSWMYIVILQLKYRILKIDNKNKHQTSTLNSTNVNSSKTEEKNTKNVKRKNTSIVIKGRLPYLNGAESAMLKRPTPLQFAKELLKYEVVSFDIFDTLLLRPFAQPHDLFMILGEKFDCLDFMTIRREAERDARNIAAIMKGNREVTIYDIYEQIEFKTGISKEYGVKTEFETELEFCFANPYMLEVFNILKSQNKKIIAISDMYLTKEMIVKLLIKSGYVGFDEVYVSSESNASKRDKNLYKIVIKKYGRNLVHVGDNFVTDIKHARESGIVSKYYKNVHEVGNKYRADEMSELIGSTYAGIINTHLHNGIKTYSPHFEFGFIYGGIYILGFCSWIYDYVKKNGIDQVLFLSRDGEIYRKVFNFLYKDVKNAYVYWSRIANMKYTIEKNRHDFLTRMILHKAMGIRDVTIASLLNSMDLTSLFKKLEKYNLKEEDIIHSGNVKLIERLFVENWGEVVEKFTEDEEIVKQYFLRIINDNKKIAIVDVGWTGSGGLGIKYLIEEKWQLDCEIHNLVAASRHSTHTANLTNIMKNQPNAYIFNRMYNRNFYGRHSNTNRGLNNMFFELFTQASYPSFSGFKRTSDGFKLEFDLPEIENYKIVNEIHAGIFEFVKRYTETFSNYKYLFNISGYDAYLPFRMIIRDLSFIKKYFGNVLFARTVMADFENQDLDSLKEILEHKGL